MDIHMTLPEILNSYHTLSDDTCFLLQEAAIMQTFRSREIIVRQGELSGYFYFINNGLTRFSYIHEGIEDTILFGTDGDAYVDLQSYLYHEPSIYSMICLDPTEVYAIPFAEMHSICESRHDMTIWMMTVCMNQLAVLEKKYAYFVNNDAESRYENFISQRGLAHKIPVKYIAQYLNIAPETLSRIRSRRSRRKSEQ